MEYFSRIDFERGSFLDYYLSRFGNSKSGQIGRFFVLI